MIRALYKPTGEPPLPKRRPVVRRVETTLGELKAFDALRVVWRRCMGPRDLALAFEVCFTCRYARLQLTSIIASMYELSPDQVQCLFRAYLGQNLFITGPAGTGKSFIMLLIHEMLQGIHLRVVRTASTGTAAINVGGVTIHSFAGIGINETMRTATLQRWATDESYVWENFQDLDTLMIDEISMLNDKQFDLIEAVSRFMRQVHKRPGGGVQFIVCGDFLQLPPVKGTFAFNSEAWRRLGFVACQLVTSHRQTDLQWYELLCRFRMGQVDDYAVGLLQARLLDRMEVPPANTDCPQLFSKRAVVHSVNAERLAQLDGAERVYWSVTEVYKIKGKPQRSPPLSLSGNPHYDHVHTFRNHSEPATKLDSNFKVEHRDALKVGARVMLVENGQAEGVANGSVGTVVEMKVQRVRVLFDALEKPIDITAVTWICLNYGRREAYSRKQIPLVLAYAITIHKAQGMGMAEVRTSLREHEIFQDGQGYVSLSRVQTLRGLQLVAFSPRAIRASPECLAFYRQLDETEERQRNKNKKLREQGKLGTYLI